MSVAYEIGPFRLDAEAGVLTKDGAPTALGSRAVAVLTALVEHPNEYVRKSAIMDAAWPRVVVEESNLAVQIFAIRRVLAEAPGAEHWVETLARRGYRFVGPVTKVATDRSRDAGSRAQRSTLPEALTSFIGRERELAEIKRLLPGKRLLTLVGAGGVGKTRLALQFAAEAVDAYRDGVWLVELAPVADPVLVPQTVATALGLKEQLGKGLTQTLTEYLAPKHMLLLVDNAEHLLAACAQLADAVLQRCPHVVLLATSREGLGIAGEVTYRVPSLSMPDPEQHTTPEQLSHYESVRLFVERAQLHLPQLGVTHENAPALASICYRLDGIPLAIELAAARVRSLSVEEINGKLDQRFRLLTGGSRTALPRQQTLRSLIDWSYDLLREPEKLFLQRLSVFAGGWTLAAAEEVCAGDAIAHRDVLDLLTSLVDKSLVVPEQEDAQTRYRLLETVRQYSRDRLEDTGGSTAARVRHRDYYLALAEKAAAKLEGAEQVAWLRSLEDEHENLRAGLAWSVAEAETRGGLRLCGALQRFWWTRGHFTEGRQWCARLLCKAGADELTRERAYVLNGAGVLAYLQGDYAAARTVFEESLVMRRELEDRFGIAASLGNLGNVVRKQGDYPAAEALYEQSLAINRELRYAFGIASSLVALGDVAINQGDYQAAKRLLQESLACQRELRDRRGISMSLQDLGVVALEQGDCPAARALLEEGLAVRRELGDRFGIASSLGILGNVAFNQGDYPAAHALYEESLAIRRELGDRSGIPYSLEGLAAVAASLRDAPRAARIWGAAERLRVEIGTPLPPNERSGYDRHVAAARIASGDDAAFDSAWREGPGLTLDQAIDLALAKPVEGG